jgi:glycosyltransferase involved in cell wall biosynthesis
MVKRRKIGIIYKYNENWIGGTYYIDNLVAALNLLSDETKPSLVVFCPDDDAFQRLARITGYPYLEHRVLNKNLNIIQRIFNRITRKLIGKNIVAPFYSYPDIDVFFPSSYEHTFMKQGKQLFWIPDFQEFHLPHFFTNREVRVRKLWQQRIVESARYIVFSSHTAKKDFNDIYPDNRLNQYVMQFAVSHTSLKNEEFSDLLIKYNLPNDYFICSNQFWRHKNHKLVLEAITLAKTKLNNLFVVFTGQQLDHRNPDYFGELKTFITENAIEKHVAFLGFIKREDQLLLLKNSIAVIQPSLFEGWSTVIEDAKALNVAIIASNLDVHKEQLQDYRDKTYFGPNDSLALEKAMIRAERKLGSYNYSNNIKFYSKVFIDIIDSVAPSGDIRL